MKSAKLLLDRQLFKNAINDFGSINPIYLIFNNVQNLIEQQLFTIKRSTIFAICHMLFTNYPSELNYNRLF